MKIAYLLTALLLSFNIFAESGVRAAQSDSADIVRVKGKGAGTSKEAALKDAFRKSVENAVGMFVDAELLADNDQLVQDKILTHCNAYIEQYEEKKCIKHDGVTEVVIVAWVRRGDLTQKLRDVMPTATVNVAEISQNLYAQIVTRDRRDADSEKLLKEVFDEFDPMTQLMNVSVVNAESPEVAPCKDSADAKVLSYQLKFQIDADNYFKIWMPYVDKILSQVSLSPGRQFSFWRVQKMNDIWNTMESRRYSEMYRADYFAYAKMYFMYAYLLDGTRIVYGDGCSFSGYGDYGLMQHIIACKLNSNDSVWNHWNNGHRPIRRWGTVPNMKARSKFYVALVKRANSGSCSGTLYELSDSSAAILSSWMTHYSGLSETRYFENKTGRSTSYHVSFNDLSGNEIAGGETRAFNHDMSNVGCVCWGDDRNCDNRNKPGTTIPYVIYITPWVGCFAGEATTWIDVEVKTDDIPKMATVSILAQADSKPQYSESNAKTQFGVAPAKPRSLGRRGLLSR